MYILAKLKFCGSEFKEWTSCSLCIRLLLCVCVCVCVQSVVIKSLGVHGKPLFVRRKGWYLECILICSSPYFATVCS